MWDFLYKIAQMSNLSYFPTKKIQRLALNFGFEVAAVEKFRDVLFIGQSNDFNIIAIRGSDKLNDWLDNLKIANRKLSEDKLGVHLGFQQRANGILRLIEPKLHLINPGKELIICGHSLGGALAFLVGVMLSKRFSNIKIVTFGCPMIGKGCWNSYVNWLTNPSNTINLQIYHVLNRFDPIIGLPFKFLGWKRPGNSVYLNDFSISGLFKSIVNFIRNKFTDHEMDQYSKLVKDKMNAK